MTNKIITKQMNNKENEGVIILFASTAKAIINGQYNRLLNKNDIKDAKVGKMTNFYNAFKEAELFIKDKNKFMKKRILFLTDGEDNSDNSSSLRVICDKMIQQNFQINIVGFGKSSKFENLRQFSSPNCFHTSQNFKDVETICQNIFAAEY